MPRRIVSDLRPVFDRAVQEERGGLVGAKQKVMNVARDIRQNVPASGLSREDALVAKTGWQNRAKSAMRAPAGEAVPIDPRAAKAVAQSLSRQAQDGAPDVSGALKRSQELMALQRATQSASGRQPLLRMLLGAYAGSGAGAMSGDVLTGLLAAAVPMAAMSPKGLSAGAHAIHKGAEPSMEALVRMLATHAQPGPGGPQP
jgi:hypothetical protein